MKRTLLDLLGQLEHSKKQLEMLEENYKNKRKTALYKDGQRIHTERIHHLLDRAENIGCDGNLFLIRFEYRYKGTKVSGRMYLKDLEEKEIPSIIKLLKKYEGIIPDTLRVTEISLGSIFIK